MGQLSTVSARCLLVVISLCVYKNGLAEYTDVPELGTSDAICVDGVDTKLDFQAWTIVNTDVIKSILKSAYWRGDPEVVISLIKKGEFKEKIYARGTKFGWLAAMRSGKPVALPKRKWTGKYAFRGYELKVPTTHGTDTLVIPKACCNFALLSRSQVRPEIPKYASAKYIPFMRVALASEKSRYRRKTVNGTTTTVCDKCGPGHTDVKPQDVKPSTHDVKPHDIEPLPHDIKPHDIEPHDIKPSQHDIKPSTHETQPSIHEVKPHEVKSYAAKAQSGNVNTLQQEGNATGESLDAKLASDRLDLVTLKLGVDVPLASDLYISPSIGVVGRSGAENGNSYPETSLHVDLELRKTFSDNWFVGGGVGSWNFDDSDYRTHTVFVSAGSKLTENISWYVEERRFNEDAEGADKLISLGLHISK